MIRRLATARVWPWASVLILIAGTVPSAQRGAGNGEWRTYGGDLGHTRYAPLDQIDAKNFSTLEIAWRFKTDNLGPRPEFQFESTPLVANGILYSTAGSRRAVVALNAATGELRWVYSLDEGKRGEAAPRQLSGRGLSYWTDGKEERILYVTPGYQMIALDARIGRPIASFGNSGIVDLKQQMDQDIDPMSREIGLHSTPIVAGDVVVVGAAHRSGGVPTERATSRASSAASTCEQASGCGSSRPSHTWRVRPRDLVGDSWSYTGNTGAGRKSASIRSWGWHTCPSNPRLATTTAASGLAPTSLRNLWWPWTSRPAYGSGTSSSCITASGTWISSSAPILADLTVNGRSIKAVAVPTKQAFLYVFDRETGEPVWPIEERPVPKGDVPREWYSPTQPFPTRPPAYDRQGLLIDDLLDFTPELRAEAVQLVSKYRIGPIFTPPVVSKIDGPLATLAMATAGGGTNWPGGSFDPETQILYVSSSKSVSQLGLVPPTDPKKNDLAFVQGNAATGMRTAPAPAARPTRPRRSRPLQRRRPGRGRWGGLTVRGLPLVKPPYGQITAIDLKRGEILWQVPHGETPDNVRNHPALKGLTIPRTGRVGTVGTLVTKTLVIAGESSFGPTSSGQRGAMLRAYDKATGAEVGAVYMPAPQGGSPMTYIVNGRQHIVVAVSGAGYSGELLAYRLP